MPKDVASNVYLFDPRGVTGDRRLTFNDLATRDLGRPEGSGTGSVDTVICPRIPDPALFAIKRLLSPCSLLPPELPRRTHFQRRMRVRLVKVLERCWQLRQHRARITQIHARHIVALEGVDEALSHSVALWAADGRVDGL